MRSSDQARLIAAMGLCLLAVPLGRWAWTRLAVPPVARRPEDEVVGRFTRIRSPTDAALREASLAWIQAQESVARELEALPTLTSEGVINHVGEAYRQGFLIRDRGGHLRRARAAAQRAATQARTPAEVYRAAEMLALIECDAGRHRVELQLARRLVHLDPRRQGAWARLRHAAVCTGRLALVREADRRLNSRE
jgi:hypothetical protein